MAGPTPGESVLRGGHVGLGDSETGALRGAVHEGARSPAAASAPPPGQRGDDADPPAMAGDLPPHRADVPAPVPAAARGSDPGSAAQGPVEQAPRLRAAGRSATPGPGALCTGRPRATTSLRPCCTGRSVGRREPRSCSVLSVYHLDR